MVTWILLIRSLPDPVVGCRMVVFILIVPKSVVGRPIKLFVGKVIFCCGKDILEGIGFVSRVPGVYGKEPVREAFTVIRVEALEEF